MRDFYRDGAKAILSLIAGPVAFLVLILGLAFLAGRCSGGYAVESIQVAALRDTIYAKDTIRERIADTVIVYREKVDKVKAQLDAIDTLVKVYDDSTVIVPDSTQTGTQAVGIPAVVVANLQALRLTVATQDTLLRWWGRKSAADSLAIVARDNMLAMKFDRPRCGRRCGFALGVGGTLLLLRAAK